MERTSNGVAVRTPLHGERGRTEAPIELHGPAGSGLGQMSRAPNRRSTTSSPSHARAQGNEKLVQLGERLHHRVRRASTGSVESFLRGIELVHDQQRLAIFF